MNDRQFPCIDCITLPICKSRIEPCHLKDNIFLTFSSLNAIIQISNKCSLIRSYIQEGNQKSSNSVQRIISTIKYLKKEICP